MNVRNAILAAADLIEINPGMWKFYNSTVPPCGSPGCALGLIGAFMGVRENTRVECVSREILGLGDQDFYARMNNINCTLPDWLDQPSWHDSAKIAAQCLRLYADKYHADSTMKTGLPDVVRDLFRIGAAA